MDQGYHPTTTIHVVQHLAPGGLECMVLNLLRLASEHHQVYVVSLEGKRQQAIQAWPKLAGFQDQLFFLDKSSGWCKNTLWKLRHLLKTIQPDVVHTHHIGPLIYGGIAAKTCQVGIRIHTEHDVWHLKNWRHRVLQKVLFEWVQPIVVGDAERVTETIRSSFNPAKAITIKNGVDCDIFRPGNQSIARMRLKLPKTVYLIGCAGRLEWVKGHDQIIKALARLPENYHLAIAGRGTQEAALQQITRHLSLKHRVHFLGLIDEMHTFYQALDLFCLPSRCEGFPLSPLEAQACGVPAIVTDTGACEETLCQQTGQLIKANCVLSLIHALRDAGTRTFTCSPRNYVEQHCNIHQMVSAYESLSMEALQ